MPFHDSRLGPGTLLLGTAPGVEYGFQVSALSLVPALSSTDGTPTLAVPAPAPESTTTWSLDGSAINDFEAVTGLQRYAYEQDGATVDFVWTPNSEAGAPTPAVLTGQLQLHAFPMGGNVGEQLVTDFSWPCVGKPAWTGGDAADPEADVEASSKRGSKAAR